jgi:hypothetical protein
MAPRSERIEELIEDAVLKERQRCAEILCWACKADHPFSETRPLMHEVPAETQGIIYQRCLAAAIVSIPVGARRH